ncbi:MAG: hypothetical protein LWW86_03165 [Micrococcales bacterium]|nr:hypothetical protein [Micrococcales bacterium]
MTPTRAILLWIAVTIASMLVGLAAAILNDRSAGRAEALARRGKRVTTRFLAAGPDGQRRVRAFVDDDDLVVIGPRTHLRVSRTAYSESQIRRMSVDEELFEFAEQRGFVDGAGRRFVLGPVEEWAPATEAALQSNHGRAGRWTRVRAALPRQAVGAALLGALALLGFQTLWATGSDVSARVVRLLPYPEDDYTDCGVRWTDPGGEHYAEVDCYAPYPKVGETIRIRALGWPMQGKALDTSGTYEGLTSVTGVLALLGAGWAVGATAARLRRPALQLQARPEPAVRVVGPDRTQTIDVARDADLLNLLDALSAREGWTDEVSSQPPEQPWYALPLMAISSARWWPIAVFLAAAVLLPEGVPIGVSYALGAAALVMAVWAVSTAIGTWRLLGQARSGPVTSEWDYRLLRDLNDDWFVLLVLGRTPHWITLLDSQVHPAPVGRCGVRGDLTAGGAVQLRIDGVFWPTGGPVDRVDEDMLQDMREEVLDRLEDRLP